MSKNKILPGIISMLFGFIVLVLAINFFSKPDNIKIAFSPIDSIGTFYFSFVFVLGIWGIILASLLLIGYLTIFYFIGKYINKCIF